MLIQSQVQLRSPMWVDCSCPANESAVPLLILQVERGCLPSSLPRCSILLYPQAVQHAKLLSWLHPREQILDEQILWEASWHAATRQRAVGFALCASQRQGISGKNGAPLVTVIYQQITYRCPVLPPLPLAAASTRWLQHTLAMTASAQSLHHGVAQSEAYKSEYVFGFGSLIGNPGFEYSDKVEPCYIKGWR
jgi:hypothetical protein